MPLTVLQRGFLKLLGGGAAQQAAAATAAAATAAAASAATAAPADPIAAGDASAEKAFEAARVEAVSAVELFKGLPGAPRDKLDSFPKELDTALALAASGSYEDARRRAAAVQGKVRAASTALTSDPAYKGYREQLAKASRLATDILAGLAELKGYGVHARLNKDMQPVIARKVAAEVAAGQQPLARSLEVMTAMTKTLGESLKLVAGVLAEKAGWDDAEAQARGGLGLIQAAREHGRPDTLARKLTDAQALARRGDFLQAVKALKGFDKEVAAEQAEARKREKALLARFEKQGAYELRLAKGTELRKAIAGLPGSRKTVDQIDTAIIEARELAKQTDFDAAYIRLKLVEEIKLADVQKDSAKALAKADKDPAFAKLRKEAQAAVDQLKGLSEANEVLYYLDDMSVLVDRIASGGKAASDMVAFERFVVRAKARIDVLKEEQRAAAAKMNAVVGKLSAIGEAAGQGAAAPFMLRAEQLGTAMGQNRFRLVIEAATALDAEAATAVAHAQAAQAAWKKSEAEVATVKAACEKIVEPPALLSEALAVVSQLPAILAVARGPTRDLEVAVASLNAQKAALEALQKRAGEFKAAGKQRGDSLKTANAKDKEVDTALAGLAAALSKARAGEPLPPGGAAALDFEPRRAELRQRWDDMNNNTYQAEDLVKGAEARVKEYDLLLADIAAAGSADGLKETVAKQKRLEGQRQFQQAWTDTEKVIRTLQTTDMAEGDRVLQRAQAARGLAATDPQAALKEISAIEADAAKRQVEAVKRRNEDRAAAKALATVVLGEIDALDKKAASKLFAPLFQALRDDHAAASLGAASDNIDAVGEALADLRVLRRKVAEMEARVGVAGPDMDNFKGVQSKLDTLQAELAKPELKELVPGRTATVAESLKAALKTLPSQSPSEAMVQLRALESALAELKQAAAKAKGVRDSFDWNAKAVGKSIKQLDKNLAYTKTLPGRLDALGKRCKTEGGEPKALEDLAALSDEVHNALDNPDVARDLDTQARSAALKAQQDKITWGSQLKRFNAVDLPSAQRAVAGGGDTSQIDELKRLRKSAENLAKAGDYAQAVSTLNMAEARVKQVLENPAGAAVGARNDLPKDIATFKAAVRKLNAALTTFPNLVKKAAAGPIDAELTSKLTDLVTKLTLVFSPIAFDAAVQRLTAPDAEANARRAAREAGLSAARALQVQLQRHPALLSLQKNPIDAAPLQTAMSGLYYALNRLEANLLRSCK